LAQDQVVHPVAASGRSAGISDPKIRSMQSISRHTKGAVAAALAVLALAGGRCFAPAVPRTRTVAATVAPGRARGALVSRAASGDAIERAAAELSKDAYPFMKQVDWNDDLFWMVPGADPISWAKACGTIIDHGASMDSELVKAGCHAHHDAIKCLPSNGVCSEAELTAINAAIGRMIASVPHDKTMDVYNAVKALVDPKVPEYLMSRVNEADAKKAYEALVKFTEVVKANPITPATPATTLSSSASESIDEAAKKLGKASYPFMKGVEWTDEFYGKTVPMQSAQETLKAVDKMIVMGAQMDSAALKDAAMAHVKAIKGMDAKGVMTPEDYEAILAGIGKTIASVPRSSVMDVYSSMDKLLRNTQVPSYLYSKQNPTDAMAAYMAFMDFKDTVRTAQQKSMPESTGLSADNFAILILLGVLGHVGGTLFNSGMMH